MRVLFASAGLTIPGGIAIHSGSILTALGELEKAREFEQVDALLFHDTRPPEYPLVKGVISPAGSSRWRFVSLLRRMVKTEKPDLVLFDSLSLARAMALPVLSRRYLVMVHGVELGPLLRPYAHRILAGSAGLIANSLTTASQAEALLPSVTRPPVSVVAPCVSKERIQTWASTDALPLRDRDPNVLTVGRMPVGPGKGHQTLLEAWPVVVGAVPEARLIVAGDGEDRERLEATADDLGMGDSVAFLGHVSDQQLGNLYATSSVFAMPSSREGFGIVYAEAMWHGLPCLGSTADAAGDVIEDQVTGVLVPYGSASETAKALIELLRDRPKSERLGQSGRRRCLDEFTHERLRERLHAALNAAIPAGDETNP